MELLAMFKVISALCLTSFLACMDEPMIHLEDIYTSGIAAALCTPNTAHISVSSRIVNSEPPDSISENLMDTNRYLIVHRIPNLMRKRAKEIKAAAAAAAAGGDLPAPQ